MNEQLLTSHTLTSSNTSTISFDHNHNNQYTPQINSTSSQKIGKMPKYAKDQPAGFKNAIERVAIVGVSEPVNNTTYTATLTNAIRLEAPLDRTLPQPSSTPEDTQSRPFPAKIVLTNSPRAS